MTGRRSSAHTLSARERMVLELVTAGLTNKEIGEAMCISMETARTYLDRIMSKLYVNNRTTVATYALLHGLVNPDKVEALWGVYRPELVEQEEIGNGLFR